MAATQDLAPVLAELQRQCHDARVLVVSAHLAGPTLRAELTEFGQLSAIAQQTPGAILYCQQQAWDEAQVARYTARLAQARLALEREPDADIDRAQHANLLRGLREAIAAAEQRLAHDQPSAGTIVSCELALPAGGVVHDLLLTTEVLNALDDAFDDMDAAAELAADPELAQTDEQLAASWEERAAQRAAQAEAARQALAQLGEQLRERLVADPTFQTTAAGDRRWKYAQRVLADEFAKTDLDQPERGTLRPYVDAAWDRIDGEIIPELRRQVIAELSTHLAQIRSTSAWQAATTVKTRTRLVREHLVQVHPLVTTPLLVDEVLAAAQAPTGQQSSLL